MVMVAPSLNPTACWEFEGEILVLHHPTTISSRYQAMGNKCYRKLEIGIFVL
jgi:GTPase